MVPPVGFEPTTKRLRESWSAFVRTGDPSNPSIPVWPAFNLNERPTMVFSNNTRMVNDPYREERLASDEVLARRQEA